MTAFLKSKDADKGYIKLESWYIEYHDEHGLRRIQKAYCDRTASEVMMAELLKRVEQTKAGILPSSDLPKCDHSVTTDLGAYRLFLESRRRSQQYVRDQFARIEAIVTGCGFTVAARINPQAVMSFLAKKQSLPKDQGGISQITVANYLRAIKGFTRWLFRHNRTSRDVLNELAVEASTTDPARERRVLSECDLEKLFETTKTSKCLMGLEGTERSVLYLLASKTGLRAKEIASLQKFSFDLGPDSQPTVALRQSATKNRQRAILPLSSRMVEAIRPLIAELDAEDTVFPDRLDSKCPWWKSAAKMLRRDLVRAGIPYRDALGRVFDFHSLRCQFITDLDRAGVSLVKAQKLARHSTPALTSKHYTKSEMKELHEAVEKLP